MQFKEIQIILFEKYGEITIVKQRDDKKGRLTHFSYIKEGQTKYSCYYERKDDYNHVFFPKDDSYPYNNSEIHKFKWVSETGNIAGMDNESHKVMSSRPRFIKRKPINGGHRPKLGDDKVRLSLNCRVSQETMAYLNEIKEITGMPLGRIIDDLVEFERTSQ